MEALWEILYHIFNLLPVLLIAIGLLRILGANSCRKGYCYLAAVLGTFALGYYLVLPLFGGTFPPPYLYTFLSRCFTLFVWTFLLLNGSRQEQTCYILFFLAFIKTFGIVFSPLYATYGSMQFELYAALDLASNLLQCGLIIGFGAFLKRYKLVMRESDWKRKWVVLIFCPISFIVVLEIGNPQNLLSTETMASVLATLLMINIPLIYYIYASVTESSHANISLHRALAESHTQLTRYRSYADLEEQLSRERHELKNRYFYIQMLLKEKRYDDLENFIRRQTDIELEAPSCIVTGNVLVDYILTKKVEEAKQKHIQSLVNASLPADTVIDEEHACTILLNLLDNAIEASEREDQRDIRVTLRGINDYLLIKVANRTRENPLERNPQLMTMKKEPEKHGFGLKIVKRILKRHNGIFNIEWDGQYFIISAMLPFLRNSEE